MNLEALLAGPQNPEDLILLMIPLGGVILLLLAFAVGGSKEKQLNQRVQQIKSGRQPKDPSGPTRKVNVKKSTADSDIQALDKLIKNALPQRELLRKRLAAAGIEAPLGRYLGICFAIGVAAALACIASGLVPPLGALFIGIVAGVAVPHVVVGAMAKRRQNKFVDAFPDAIDLMVRGLKSGLPISESIKTAGQEVPDPVGEELRRVTDAVRMGTKLEEALWETAERLNLQEFKFFTVSLSIQAETGGNLSESLGNLSSVLRGRRQLKMKIKAMSSEAKASAYIIGSLPFVVGSLIYFVNNSYVMKLFIDSRGNVMLAIGALMFMIGGGVMYKMVKFEI